LRHATNHIQQRWQQLEKTKIMIEFKSNKVFTSRTLILAFLTLLFSSCNGQVTEKSANKSIKEVNNNQNKQPLIFNQNTVFKQTHSNLNGMVSEFVRKIYQDKKGNYWFGTNGDGIINYNGITLEKQFVNKKFNHKAVRGIVEDKKGNIWFGTSGGLTKYDGENFTNFSEKDGLLNNEIWGLTIDKNGLIWIGTTEGVCQFNGTKFSSFPLPETKVENSSPMLSDKLVFKFLEDKNENMWFVTDGNGIFIYNGNKFTHLTKDTVLTDNSVADILEDRKGNIWIGTFYGGVSKFDGNTYTNFTKEGLVEGTETYNFCEDTKGNIWFSAENYGVYKYDGAKFTQFTVEDGLATNTIQSIYEDNKGQLWFGTWEGISLYDGKIFMNVSDKEPWTK
jgi:ligand-binding sensor domain-containing protein